MITKRASTTWLAKLSRSSASAGSSPTLGRELTRAEYFRLLNAARAAGNKRTQLLLEALCSTGIRVSELQFITAEAVRRQ